MKFPNIEETLKVIFGQAPFGIVIVDFAGVVVEVNENYASYYGAAPEAMIGKAIKDYMKLEENHPAHAAYDDLINGQTGSTSVERCIILPNGSEKWFKTYASTMQSNGSKFIIGILVDITLEKTERDINRLLCAVDQAIVSSLDDSSLKNILSIIREFLGWSSISYWKGKSGFKIDTVTSVSEERSPSIEHLHTLIINSLDQAWPLWDNKKNSLIVPLYLEDKSFGFILCHGIDPSKSSKFDDSLYVSLSRRISFFLEKKEMDAKLLQSAKMASLGELASGIAHEINNPLTVVFGKSCLMESMLQESQINKELLLKWTQQIKFHSDRIVKIIKSLKTFSRSGMQQDFVQVTVQQLVDEVAILTLERFDGSGIRFDVSNPFPDVQIICQKTLIQNVILNLIENAKHAVLETHNAQKIIEFGVKKDNENKITFFVKDNGSGISSEISDKIFNPFVTSKSIDKGTGLGLSIAKNIIEGHKGDIWFDSSSKGTTFYFDVPIKL